MKRILSVLLLAVLLCGCTAVTSKGSSTQEPEVVLRYYSIGRAEPDLEMVSDALNQLMIQRYGFGVEYRMLDFNEYIDTTTAMINTGSKFDVMFTWGSHYSMNAANYAFLPLDSYLDSQAYSLYNVVDPLLWQGVTINGKIFGVPTNKELAPVVQFVFSRDLIEKYNIQPEKYKTLDSLEPLLAMIHRKEPNVIPMLFTSERVNLTELTGYEYVAGENLPFVVKQGDPECKVVNIYETEEMQHLQDTLRRYYQKGYINADATVRTAISRFSQEQVFCRIGVGGPEAEKSFSVDFGYPIVSVETSAPWITNTAARGGIMAINSRTPHPKEAVIFLTAVNLDPDVRNLLNFGVEGVHYQLSEENQVRMISDRYRSVPYAQGNWYILNTMEGEDPNKWDHYREYNKNAKPSYLLGFEPNLNDLKQESTLVSRAYCRYDNALLTGSVDPEEYRALALKNMSLAGENAIRQKLQEQVNAWLRNQSQSERNG